MHFSKTKNIYIPIEMCLLLISIPWSSLEIHSEPRLYSAPERLMWSGWSFETEPECFLSLVPFSWEREKNPSQAEGALGDGVMQSHALRVLWMGARGRCSGEELDLDHPGLTDGFHETRKPPHYRAKPENIQDSWHWRPPCNVPMKGEFSPAISCSFMPIQCNAFLCVHDFC